MVFGLFKNRSKRAATNKISSELIEHIGRIAKQQAKGKRNEEETRRWCVDMLRSAFGYKDSELETELSILGQRVDIALLDGDRVIAVIECKATTVELNHAAINQAANYATSLGTEWVVVTNGRQWGMFHISPARGSHPDIGWLFFVDILDDDGLSKADADQLYLLTKQAIMSGETMQAFHQAQLTSLENLRVVLSSPEIVSVIAEKLATTYRRTHGVPIEADGEAVQAELSFMVDAAELQYASMA